MKEKWSTRTQDLYYAKEVISQYRHEEKTLGIFEIVTSKEGKDSVFLAEWVLVLIQHYRHLYGKEKGDFVMKQVVSTCLINGESVH